MKIGDLVKYRNLFGVDRTGIIVGFDEDNDPIVRENETGYVAASSSLNLETISESR